MKRDRIIYWTVTGLLSAMLLMSASMYLFNNAMVQETFGNLGFPVFIIYPLAALKILGVATILMNRWPLLVNMAYAGFFFNFVLATGAHIAAADGEFMGGVIALFLLSISYIFKGRVYNDTLSLSPTK